MWLHTHRGFMDTIAHWGYMDTVRESALKVDSGRTALIPQFRTFLRLSMTILCAQWEKGDRLVWCQRQSHAMLTLWTIVRCGSWKASHNNDMGSSPWRGKQFFSQSQFPMQTVLQCLYSPHVQPYASTSLRALKIPNPGSHSIVWTHKKCCTH